VSSVNAESSGVGKVSELSEQPNPQQFFESELTKDEALKINFQYSLTPQVQLSWDTILWKNNLYIEVPNGCLPDASKEAFVALLEYAEDVLKCDNAIVCFLKERYDRSILVRTFMFLGFYAVPQGDALSLPVTKDHIYMVYKITM